MVCSNTRLIIQMCTTVFCLFQCSMPLSVCLVHRIMVLCIRHVNVISSTVSAKEQDLVKHWFRRQKKILHLKARYLQLKDHVEHSIRAVGFQQLHNMGVFKHVTDAGLPLQVWNESTKKVEERVSVIQRAKTLESSYIPCLF